MRIALLLALVPLAAAGSAGAQVPDHIKPLLPKVQAVNDFVAASASGNEARFDVLVTDDASERAPSGTAAPLTIGSFEDLSRRCEHRFGFPASPPIPQDRITVVWDCPEDKDADRLHTEFRFTGARISLALSERRSVIVSQGREEQR